MTKPLVSIVFLLAAALLAACSFSESSKSSSTSSGSISDSASSPSSSVPTSKDKQKSGYASDVRDYTAEFVKSSNTSIESFRGKLGKIASNYGVTQWDQDKSTYVAIGKGLRKAGLSKAEYESFKSILGESQAWKMESIEEGYK